MVKACNQGGENKGTAILVVVPEAVAMGSIMMSGRKQELLVDQEWPDTLEEGFALLDFGQSSVTGIAAGIRQVVLTDGIRAVQWGETQLDNHQIIIS